MTNFTNPGTNLTARAVFNSGTLDFGNSRVVYIDSISVEVAWTLLDLFILGSVRTQDKVRHSEKVTISGKLKSYGPELEMVALGSSTIGATNTANTIDGQPTFQNPVITLFDRNNKEIQYQISNAIFKSTKVSSKQEDYSEWNFEIEAMDLVEIYTP